MWHTSMSGTLGGTEQDEHEAEVVPWSVVHSAPNVRAIGGRLLPLRVGLLLQSCVEAVRLMGLFSGGVWGLRTVRWL